MSRYAALIGAGVMFGGLAAKGVMKIIRQQKIQNFGVDVHSSKGLLYQGNFEAVMTRKEAALILGTRETAPDAEISEAYKKIMKMNHPDWGGSAFIATKINQARDVLLLK